MQVSVGGSSSSITTTSSASSVAASAGHQAGRCRANQVDFSPHSLATPGPSSSSGTSPSATPVYLPTKLEPAAAASLFVGDEVIRCVTSSTAAGLPRRLVSTPLIASSQVIDSACIDKILYRFKKT